MTIRWGVVALVVMVNTLVCFSMFGIQQIEVSNGTIPPLGTIIPGTQQLFLHWQQWSSLIYGDFFGLVLVQVAFVHLWLHHHISRQQKMWLVVIAILAFVGMYLHQSSPTHKPDWCCPIQGQFSWAGIAHLFYFGANVGIGAICIYHWRLTGILRGKLLAVGLCGAAIWGGSFTHDLATGKATDFKLEKAENH